MAPDAVKIRLSAYRDPHLTPRLGSPYKQLILLARMLPQFALIGPPFCP